MYICNRLWSSLLWTHILEVDKNAKCVALGPATAPFPIMTMWFVKESFSFFNETLKHLPSSLC